MNQIFNHSAASLLMAGFAPVTQAAQESTDPMFESAEQGKNKNKDDRNQAMFEAVERRSQEDARSLAASLLMGWVSEGDSSAEDFETLAITLGGLESVPEDQEYTDEQVDAFNDALAQLADAAVALGADQDDVTSMIDDDDDNAAERVYEALSGLGDEDEAITDYTIAGGKGGDVMLESATFKAVRDGVVKLIRKRPKKRRMTSLQKAALKKARAKAHSSVANAHRKKSMKLRKKRGL